ncbi:MAG: hypothetical protein H5T65_08820 [Chloroflexi bacterium]|nr:hypothetical protein [Chloroflexota bacterium]
MMQQKRLMRAAGLLAVACACVMASAFSATQALPSQADVRVASDGAWNVRALGQMPSGRKTALAVRDGYAYLAIGTRLVIADVSDPTAPKPVGWTDALPHSVLDIALSGNYAYLADGHHGLRLVDISDPTHPWEVSSYDTPGYAMGVAVAGHYAYIADYDGGLRIIDVSNPHRLVETSFLYLSSHATDVAVVGDYVFAGVWGLITISGNYAYVVGTISIIDVSDPYAPREIGPLPLSLPGGMHIVDVSDLAHPVEVGAYIPEYYDDISAISVWGNRACIGLNHGNPFYEDGSLAVLDLGDITSPVRRGVYRTEGSISAVSVTANYAYVADAQKGLLVLDISNPDSPAQVGAYLTPHHLTEMTTYQDHLLVTTGESLAVVDFSEASGPQELGFCDYGGIGGGGPVVTSRHYAFVAVRENLITGKLSEILVINLAAPQSPTLVGRWHSWDYRQNDLAAAGNYVYTVVFDPADGYLRIVDVADPERWWMDWLGYCRTPGDAFQVAVSEGYAYVADGRGGLRIIDVSDPTNPTEVGAYAEIDTARYVAVGDSYAYVVGGKRIWIIDISDPTHPTKAGEFDIPGWVEDIAFAQPYLYVADPTFGLRVLDVSDAAHPREVGFYEIPDGASHVAVGGDIIYVANVWWDGMIWFLRFPAEPEPRPTSRPTATPFPAQTIAIEAEHGYVVRPGMDLGAATQASQCGFVETRLGNQGSVTLTFYVHTPGNYAIWARVQGSGEYTGNSFFVSIDGAERFWHEFVPYGPTPPTWIWSRVHMYGRPVEERYYFGPGVHTLRFDGREMGARLDKVLLTTDLSYTPGDQDVVPCSLNTPTATPTHTPLRPILPTYTPTRTPTPTPTATPTPSPTPTPRAKALLPVIVKGVQTRR